MSNNKVELMDALWDTHCSPLTVMTEAAVCRALRPRIVFDKEAATNLPVTAGGQYDFIMKPL